MDGINFSFVKLNFFTKRVRRNLQTSAELGSYSLYCRVEILKIFGTNYKW